MLSAAPPITITNNDEVAYREIRLLAQWWKENNLALNVSKTKEMTLENPQLSQKRPINTFISPGICREPGCPLLPSLVFTGLLSLNRVYDIRVDSCIGEQESTAPTAPFYPLGNDSELSLQAQQGLRAIRQFNTQQSH